MVAPSLQFVICWGLCWYGIDCWWIFFYATDKAGVCWLGCSLGVSRKGGGGVWKDIRATATIAGLGHLLGLETHDVGGYIAERYPARSDLPGLKSLRTARSGYSLAAIPPDRIFLEIAFPTASSPEIQG